MTKIEELDENIKADRSDLLFRGKDGQGIEHYGGYCRMADCRKEPGTVRHYIIPEASINDWGKPDRMEFIEVIPETLCRCAGVTDMDGKMIFEGDILEYDTGHPGRGICEGVVRFGPYMGSSGGTHLGFSVQWRGEEAGLLRPDLLWWAERCRVTGSVSAAV